MGSILRKKYPEKCSKIKIYACRGHGKVLGWISQRSRGDWWRAVHPKGGVSTPPHDNCFFTYTQNIEQLHGVSWRRPFVRRNRSSVCTGSLGSVLQLISFPVCATHFALDIRASIVRDARFFETFFSGDHVIYLRDMWPRVRYRIGLAFDVPPRHRLGKFPCHASLPREKTSKYHGEMKLTSAPNLDYKKYVCCRKVFSSSLTYKSDSIEELDPAELTAGR